jgi:hypothetical protein
MWSNKFHDMQNFSRSYASIKKKVEHWWENKGWRECVHNHIKEIASEMQGSRYVYYTMCD